MYPTIARSARPTVTFAVDDVARATETLPETKTHLAVEAMLESPVESCCDYSDDVVADVRYHPLLAAVFLAYSQHRPLVLTPDAMWLTIAQGVAHHMVLHADRLRPRFVKHQGRLDLIIELRGWVKGSPENPWPEAFAAWTSLIRDHVGGEMYDLLVSDFSTSGVVERAVSHVVMMDIFERYFHYVALCVCGIPTITLEGPPGDWDRLREKVRGLAGPFDLKWWTKHLLPICDQFCRAARGDVGRAHWQRICKLREEYGGDIINGWVAKLFPYIREWTGGPARYRNPIFEKSSDGITTYNAPLGLSRVPFTWVDALTEKRHDMEAIGGVVGVTQDKETLALRPKVGWAVRQPQGIDFWLLKLERDGHLTRPPTLAVHRADRQERSPWDALPADVSSFYFKTDGAELFGRGDAARFRILPRAQVTHLSGGEDWNQPNWYRVCQLADGTELAINIRDEGDGLDLHVHRVCHVTHRRFLGSATYTQVATSFTEMLRKMLDNGGKYWWLKQR